MEDANRNGHTPEETVENLDSQKEVFPTGHQDRPKSTGYTQGQAVPSIHDLAMMAEKSTEGAAFNLAKELITGSRLPEEYLPRGVYTDQDIARRKRLVAKHNRVNKRRGSSLNDSIWVGDQMSIAKNGAGREDAKEVAKAAASIDRDERLARRQGFMGMGRPQG